jgi:hypothetical protein
MIMKFYKLIVLIILLSLQLSLQVSAFEQKDFYEKNLRMRGIITHIVDDPEKQVQTENSSARRDGKKVDGVIPKRVFVPSFKYLDCGFTLPCKISAESDGKKREVLPSEAIKQEVDGKMMWALCVFISLLQNTIKGTNMTCVNIGKTEVQDKKKNELAKLEDERAQLEAGLAYAEKDYKTAYKLYLPIAEQGNYIAQYKLGQMYENGDGVPQNYKEAVNWYRLSAEQEYQEATMRLGILYLEGKGVAKDTEEAKKLLTLAAEGRIAQAQYILALLIHKTWLKNKIKGLEIRKEDLILAHKWVNLSIANFDAITQSATINSAKKLRANIEKDLTPSQLEKAQSLAKE